MSYEPSHRKPPRQERWPQATPPEGWPSYRQGGAYQGGQRAAGWGARPEAAGYRGQAGYQQASGGSGYPPAVVTAPFPPGGNGYGSASGYGWTRDAYRGYGADNRYGTDSGYGPGDGFSADGSAQDGGDWAEDGFAGSRDDFAGSRDGGDWAEDGFAGSRDDFAGSRDGGDWAEDGFAGSRDDFAASRDDFAGSRNDFAGSGGYLGTDGYPDTASHGPELAAPDAGVHPDSWRADQQRRGETGERGLAVSVVTGLLAAAVAIGISTLAAAFAGSATSPAAAMGGVFIDRTPAAVRNFAAQHFGAHGHAVLLLGMYVAIACIAVGIGLLTRHAAALGVAGVAAFSMAAAFVTVTRPGSQVSDVAPAVVGGLAAVAALLWLVRASAPVTPLRHARGGARRRAR